MLARQPLYHLNHGTAFFYVGYFDRVLFYVWTSLDDNYPIHTSCVAEMTGAYHTQLFIS
jgi:hypothetical protein